MASPQKPKAAIPRDKPAPDSFTREVERALDDFADPELLGTHSPLAAPYFLGQLLNTSAEEEATARGQTLQRLLRTTAETLEPSQHSLLTHTYFARDANRNNVGIALALGLNDRTFYRNRVAAVAALAQAIAQRVLPPVQLELPFSTALVGREALLHTCVAALRQHESVMLLGPSGIGKTTLGSAIAQQFNEVFWFTVRPGLTDSLSSFAFALAYFLRLHSARLTWQQLIADAGRIQTEHLLGLLRFDLKQFSAPPGAPDGDAPLLCVDELDLLDPDIEDHARVLQLLEELKTLAPLLLIGQRAVIPVQHDHTLIGLSQDELRTWLLQQRLALNQPAQMRLHQTTRGNPALLKLFAALFRLMGDAQQALNSLGDAPSIDAIFNRIWRHLSEAEQLTLMRLAVFNAPAPSDMFAEQATVLQRLLLHDLARSDERGGIGLAPHLRRTVTDKTPAQLLPLLHLQAAETREARSEFTLAMQHYCAGHKPAHAVRIWFTHRVQETNRGQGAAALSLLMSIDPSALTSAQSRDTLRIARAELFKMMGKSEEAEEELSAIKRSASRSLRAYTLQLQGDVFEIQSRLDQSLRKYEEALDTLLELPQTHVVQLLVKMSSLYKTHLHDMHKARERALLARVRAEVVHGSVEERDGNYREAEARYTSALQIADQLENALYDKSVAYSYLGQLQWKIGKPDAAVQSLQTAIQLSETRGDVVGALFDRYTLTAAHIVAGRHAQALAQAQETLQIAESLKLSYLVSGLSANAAEACYGLGRFDDAELFAFKSLNQEEEILRTYALTVLGLVRQAQGKVPEAVKLLRDSIASAQDVDDRYAEAAAWRALGDVQRSAQQDAEMREAYAHARALYAALGLEKELKELGDVTTG